MNILLQVLLYLIAGVVILTYGANLFVSSASHTARRFGISPLIIGLTIVSAGTSAPELAVNVLASFKGNSEIALGNVIGSNIFNILVIIGICSLIIPLSITQQLIKIDIPIMIAISAITWFFSRDGVITFYESLFFIINFLAYTWLQIYLSRKEKQSVKDEYAKEYSQHGSPLKDTVLLGAGLILLVVGAKLFVEGAVDGATYFGISQSVIALTIVSAGTSLPEVATSVVATIKGEKDIAVGNVIGSNIFNIVAVLGLSGLVIPSHELLVSETLLKVDIPLMIVISAICAPLSLFRLKFERWVGVIFLAIYIIYVYYLLNL